MFIWIWAVATDGIIGNSVFRGKYSVGKSGAWPKIFGLKVWRLAENIRLGIRKSLENIRFEIRKIWDISGIINLWVVVAFGRSPTYILRHFVSFALIMVSGFATIYILSVRLYRF